MWKWIILSIMVVAGINKADKIEVTAPGGKVSVRVNPLRKTTKTELSTPMEVESWIKEDIELLREVYLPKIRDKKAREQALAILNELEDLVTLIIFFCRRDVPFDIPFPMTPEDFNLLLSKLKSESFSEDQLELLKTAVVQNYFTVDQLCHIMRIFSMDEDKVEAVRVGYPRVVDKGNGFKLLDEVTFSDSKKEIKEIITSK